LTIPVKVSVLQAGSAHMLVTQELIGATTDCGPFPRPTKTGSRRLGLRQAWTWGLPAMFINVVMQPIEYEFADTTPTRAEIVVIANNMLISKGG